MTRSNTSLAARSENKTSDELKAAQSITEAFLVSFLDGRDMPLAIYPIPEDLRVRPGFRAAIHRLGRCGSVGIDTT